MTPDQQQTAERLLGGLPIIQMYGMTETDGRICSKGVSPRRRQLDTVGQSAGPDVVIFDTVGSPVPNGQEGEVCIRSDTVMSGYEGMSRDGVFWGEWFRSGDIGVMQPDGYLRLTGHIK